MTAPDFTLDGFLGGLIEVRQPKQGFRAGHDTVLLAAAIPARAGEHVLELGSGAGVGSLCLAARVECEITGVELDAALVALANENAKANGYAERVKFVAGDARSFFGGPYDRGFFNPPFHHASGDVSPNPARDAATRDSGDALHQWTANALRQVHKGGTVTLIVRADRVPELVAAFPRAGLSVLPLRRRADESPKRAVVRLEKGSTAPMREAKGLVLHETDGTPTSAAEAVLRHAAALDWE